PSLNFMLLALMLAVLAGLGAASLIAWHRRAGQLLTCAGMVLILAEGWSVAPTAGVPTRAAVYDAIAASPEGTAVVEFPFGDPGISHWVQRPGAREIELFGSDRLFQLR